MDHPYRTTYNKATATKPGATRLVCKKNQRDSQDTLVCTASGDYSHHRTGLFGALMTRYLLNTIIAAALSFTLGSPGFAVDRAKGLFNLCSSCHGLQGEGNQPVGAPAIAGLPEWYLTHQLEKFKAGIRGAHPKDISGVRMRAMGRALTDEDIKISAAYVAGLPSQPHPTTVKGSLVRGEAQFQLCATCHGAKAEGNQTVGAPPLTGLNDWYILSQLHNFKSKARGGNATLDPMGAVMTGIAATLDDDAMKNVVSYIGTLVPASTPSAKP